MGHPQIYPSASQQRHSGCVQSPETPQRSLQLLAAVLVVPQCLKQSFQSLGLTVSSCPAPVLLEVGVEEVGLELLEAEMVQAQGVQQHEASLVEARVLQEQTVPGLEVVVVVQALVVEGGAGGVEVVVVEVEGNST